MISGRATLPFIITVPVAAFGFFKVSVPVPQMPLNFNTPIPESTVTLVFRNGLIIEIYRSIVGSDIRRQIHNTCAAGVNEIAPPLVCKVLLISISELPVLPANEIPLAAEMAPLTVIVPFAVADNAPLIVSVGKFIPVLSNIKVRLLTPAGITGTTALTAPFSNDRFLKLPLLVKTGVVLKLLT